ncbi:hypothetical protein M885DRAFT_509363 [Pelagophyceae sp. CCMP2097]|nr:hypothetical protein M885DRAFT_509363 [Pelagophyceae sp. CCMP2097]
MAAEVVQVVVREFERYLPGRGFSKRHLAGSPFAGDALPGARATQGSTPDAAAPAVQSWLERDWRVVIDAESDDRGWRYGGGSHWRSRCGLTDVARERRWARMAVVLNAAPAARPDAAAGDPRGAVTRGPDAPDDHLTDSDSDSDDDADDVALLSLARTIREQSALLARIDRDAAKLEGGQKDALRKEASRCADEAARCLVAAGVEERAAERAPEDDAQGRRAAARQHRAAARLARARADACVQRQLFPGYDASSVFRGDGVVVGVRGLSVERVSGHFLVEALAASPADPKPHVSVVTSCAKSQRADGDSPDASVDDAGFVVHLVLDGLGIKSDSAAASPSVLPNLFLRRVSLQARVTVSARLVLQDADGPSARRWAAETFEVRLLAWSSPGLFSRATAAAVLRMMRPALRRTLEAALPPELGDFFASGLREPCRVGGDVDVRSEPASCVSSARLDADGADGDDARRLVGWTALQAASYVEFVDDLFPSAERTDEEKDLCVCATLADAVSYVRRTSPQTDAPDAPDAPAASPRQPHDRAARDERLHRGSALDAAWDEAAELWCSTRPADRRFAWRSLRAAAARLDRRPLRVALRLPVASGAFAVPAARAAWATLRRRTLAERPDAGDFEDAAADRREVEAAATVSELLERVSCASHVQLDVSTDGVSSARLGGPLLGATGPRIVEAYALASTWCFARGTRERTVPCNFRVRADGTPDGRRDGVVLEVFPDDEAPRAGAERRPFLSLACTRPTVSLNIDRAALNVDRTALAAADSAQLTVAVAKVGHERRLPARDLQEATDSSPRAQGPEGGVPITIAVDAALHLAVGADAVVLRCDTAHVLRWLRAQLADAAWCGVDEALRADCVDVCDFALRNFAPREDGSDALFPRTACLKCSLDAALRRGEGGESVFTAATCDRGLDVELRCFARDVLGDFSLALSARHRRASEGGPRGAKEGAFVG